MNFLAKANQTRLYFLTTLAVFILGTTQAFAFPFIDGAVSTGEWDGATIQSDPAGDMTPANMLPGATSGYDIVEMKVIIDPATNDMYFLLDTLGVPGDADGDGDPSGSSNPAINDLDYIGGTPPDNQDGIGGPESYRIFLDCVVDDGVSAVTHELWIINNTPIIWDVMGATPVQVPSTFNWAADSVVEIMVNGYDVCADFISGDGFSFQTQGLANTPFDGPQFDIVPDSGFLLVEPVGDVVGDGNGTATIGYWKNHMDAWWPAIVDGLEVAGEFLTQAQATAILRTPTRGNKIISLAKQLIATKLNYWDGNDTSCVDANIIAADDWIILNGGLDVVVRKWADDADLVHDELDAYNNGMLCAPHRD